jgi:Pectate lyase superfamily protein/Concanavalin A-like lectin/glucanases superfamily
VTIQLSKTPSAVILFLFVLPFLAAKAPAAELEILSFETGSASAEERHPGGVREALVAAPFLYDPLTGRSTPNQQSLRLKGGDAGAALELKTGWTGGSFTIECYAKPERDPRHHIYALAAGKHRAGCSFLNQWNQTYWGGFSDAAKEGSWQNGHYVTIARLVEAGGDGAENLVWRHLALVFDAEAKTLTTWLDHWQQASVALTSPLVWDGCLLIGGGEKSGAWEGWIDSVRYTPRRLATHEFLRSYQAAVEQVSLAPVPGRFHPESGVLDARAHFGAVGDGKHDDTAALQRAFSEAPPSTTVYLPAGTYLVSGTLGFRQFRIVAGEGRDKTVIRLRDKAPGFNDPGKAQPVLRCLFNNNQSIANYIEHLTINTGSGNPGAVALRYNAHNQGWVDAVRLVSGDGAGVCGLDLTETEFGPALISDLIVEGFDVGIEAPGNLSNAVLEDIVLRGQRVAGLRNGMPLQLHRLRSTNRVPAVINQGWMAQLTLVDAELSGGAQDGAAIINDGPCYLRDVTSSGYGVTLIKRRKDEPDVPERGPIKEYVSGSTHALFGQAVSHLNLAIEQPAPVFLEPPAQWKLIRPVEGDDTAAVQAAMDSGAATVCFIFGHHYELTDTIRIPPVVRRVVGMRAGAGGAEKIFGKNKPLFRIEGGTAGTPPLTIEQIWPSVGNEGGLAWELATARDVHLKAASGHLRNTAAATGRLFITETLGYPRIEHPQRVWIRQLNTETHPDINPNYNAATHIPPTYLYNKGGTVWVLGQKTEHIAIHAHTLAGGRTEILGGFFRDHVGSKGVPYFLTENAECSANWMQYAWQPGAARALQAREKQGGKVRELIHGDGNGIFGLYRAGK